MKRLIALLLSLTFVLTLAGCGKTTGGGDPVVGGREPVAGGADMPTVGNDEVIETEQAQPAVTEDFVPTIKYPSVQEYVAGQGNKGNVPVEEYISISEDFAIGANKDGYAVFKDPEKALAKLLELYSDGITLIQTAYDFEPLSVDNCTDYKIYGSQITTGTEEEQQQAIFVAKFLDIYENSYIGQ